MSLFRLCDLYCPDEMLALLIFFPEGAMAPPLFPYVYVGTCPKFVPFFFEAFPYLISTLKFEKIKYFDKFKKSETIVKNKKLKKKSVIIKYLKLKLQMMQRPST